MRALAFPAFGEPLTIVELPEPLAPPGGVVVRVEATGLCRSDWHGWMGHDDDITAFPHVGGHEFAGRIAALGEGVDAFAVGDRVTAPFVQACGDCATCREGSGQICPNQRQPGFTDPGSFAEFVVVRAASTNLVRLPDAVPAAHAAALGCRVATAFRAIVHRARLQPGEWLAVFGCGGVGLAAIQIGVALGARVVAVDTAPGSRERAEQLGAEAVLDAAGAPEAIAALTGGGAHVSVDALGSASTVDAALGSLRRHGRHVQVGLLPGTTALQLGRVISFELDVLGSHGMAAADYAELLAWVAGRRLDLGALLVPGPPLGLAEAAPALMRMGEVASGGVLIVDPRR